MTVLNNPVLWLNKSWLAHDSKTVEDSFSLVCSERGLFLDSTSARHDIGSWINLPVEDGAEFIQLSQTRIRVPEILLLADYNRIPARTVVFCRRNVWRRDQGYCFVPETLILMANGALQRIDSIQEGDKVLDAEGKMQTVEFVFSKHTNEDLVVLRHRGNGDFLTCTPNHRILVSDKNFKTRWVEAQDVTMNDYLCELNLYNQIAQSVDDIDLYEICSSLSHLKCSKNSVQEDVVEGYNRKSVSRYLSVDENLGRFVGYFLAEGNVDHNRITFSFHIDEDDFADDTEKLIRSIFNIEVSHKLYPNKHVRQVMCYSSIVAEFVRNWCFYKVEKSAHAKDLPIAYFRGVLYGIMRGDGTFNEVQSRATLMMSRENLIRDIYLMSHICGIKATLSKTGHRADERIYKSVVYNAGEFNKITQVCDLKKKPYTQNCKIDRLFDEEGARFISKVTSITRMPYQGLVHDLQISGSHTYVADFVCVHNCQYCGKQPASDDITLDHIHPQSKGGLSTFENCVLCCTACNLKKGNRSLGQAGMQLQKRKRHSSGEWSTICYDRPKRPMWNPLYTLRRRTYPKSWAAFLKNFDESLYWEVELEK